MKRIAIKYLFNIFSGSTPESGQSLFWDGDYNWFTPDDLGKLGNQIFVTDSKRKVTEEGIDNANLKFAKENSIIISKRAPIGNLAILSKAASCNQGCFILEEKIDLVNSKYYYYFLSIQKDNLNSLGRGSTFLELNADDMKSFTVPYPTLVQQNKIVAYLDQEIATIDALIEKKSRLAELLEEKKKATISQAVTKGLNPNVKLKSSGIDWLGDIPEHWEVKKLKYVLKSLNSIRIPLSAEERGLMSDKTYDYYGASGVIDKVEDYLFAEPLILIGEDGANLLSRNSRLVFIAEGKYWVNNHAHILKPLYGNMIYYCEMMETLDFSLWVSGSAQPKLTSENLMNIEIIVPPNNEQDSISIYLQELNNKFDILFEKINNSIDLLKEKRTAIISAAINGEINLD